MHLYQPPSWHPSQGHSCCQAAAHASCATAVQVRTSRSPKWPVTLRLFNQNVFASCVPHWYFMSCPTFFLWWGIGMYGNGTAFVKIKWKSVHLLKCYQRDSYKHEHIQTDWRHDTRKLSVFVWCLHPYVMMWYHYKIHYPPPMASYSTIGCWDPAPFCVLMCEH